MSEASQKTQDLLAQYENERERYDQDMADCEEDTTECKDSNKAAVFSTLKAAGINLVTVGYSGACDDGQIDDVPLIRRLGSGHQARALDGPPATARSRS